MNHKTPEEILSDDVLGKSELDPFGFPMIWIPSLDAHVHWLPMTKIQFELFLARGGADEIDAKWYARLYEKERRVSAHELTIDDFWRSLLTGVLPQEAQIVAEWLGKGFRLLTSEEWLRLFQETDQFPAREIDWSATAPSVSLRCSDLLQAFAELPFAGRSVEPTSEFPDGRMPPTLADQMLLRGGLLEWVETESETGWGGLGQVHDSLHRQISRLQDGEVQLPHSPTEKRIRHFGFRLIRKPSDSHLSTFSTEESS